MSSADRPAKNEGRGLMAQVSRSRVTEARASTPDPASASRVSSGRRSLPARSTRTREPSAAASRQRSTPSYMPTCEP